MTFGADGSRVPTFFVHGIDVSGVFTVFGRITYVAEDFNESVSASVCKYE